MVTYAAKKIVILGLTHSGRVFRPSDWAERLAGVMSQFRPGNAKARSHISYSPWCVPSTSNGVKCVVVSEALRAHNVMAWDFCINFARDNELQVQEHVAAPAANVVPLHPAGHSHHAHSHAGARAHHLGAPAATVSLRVVAG